nr:EOG090X03B7 [Eulimnadia texana]
MDLDKTSAILPANRAMAYLKLNKFNEAEEDCTLSLKLDPSYLKAYHRRGCARVQLGKYAEAEEDFRKVLAMEPHNKAAEQELNNLKSKTKTLPTQKQTPTVEKPKIQETKRNFSNLFQVMKEVQATKKDVKGLNLIAVPVSSAKNDTEEDENIKKIFQEWSKPLKTEKPVESVLKSPEVKIPAVPKTSFQFTNDWKKLGSDFDLRCRYLQQISPEKFPDIFRDAMESEILGDIVKILVNQLSFSNEQRSVWLKKMAFGPLIAEIIFTFLLASFWLYRYGDWYRHHFIVTGSVLVAWYFSFLIIFILPLDVTSTAYRQCVQESLSNETNSTFSISSVIQNGTANATDCKQPWSYVPETVMPQLWRVLYWTSQFLTWLVLPLMQSYTKAGDFTVKGKLKSALIDNAIYYGSYLVIASILLIYLAAQPEFEFDWPKLKAIAASASNTWGLFWLVLLLGYGLVDIPRTVWRSSKPGPLLTRLYFKAAKLNAEKSEAEETLEDHLETLQAALNSLNASDPLRKNAETILDKVPLEWREKMKRTATNHQQPAAGIGEKSLVKLHRLVLKALQTQHRTETQWINLVERIIDLEDVFRNIGSHERHFKTSFEVMNSSWTRYLYNPTIEWYWRCLFKPRLSQILAVLLAVFSALVVWSELTFFNASPVLSLFAIFVNLAKASYDYISIELVSIATIAYLCICAYSTVFKIRVLNLYYLAPHHHTDEYSLIFSGMLLCRLTPPMCLNFLGLIHMDSHIIKARLMETYYTQIMGHMDVLPIISDGFNVYFPMAILGLCLATYFSLGSRLLSLLGFQQFVGDDNDITLDLVDEGRELIKREKRRRQRSQTNQSRRAETETYSAVKNTRNQETGGLLTRRENSRSELLGINEPAVSASVTDEASLDDLFVQSSGRRSRGPETITASFPAKATNGQQLRRETFSTTFRLKLKDYISIYYI